MRTTKGFGLQLLGRRDSSGWQTTPDLHLHYKKQEPESTTAWISLGGAKCQKSIGETQNNKKKSLKSSFQDFGIQRFATKEFKWFLFPKT